MFVLFLIAEKEKRFIRYCDPARKRSWVYLKRFDRRNGMEIWICCRSAKAFRSDMQQLLRSAWRSNDFGSANYWSYGALNDILCSVETFRRRDLMRCFSVYQI